METCENCQQPVSNGCICAAVDKFFDDNRDLMEDLAVQEEKDKAQRCLACYFAPCRCTAGLQNK